MQNKLHSRLPSSDSSQTQGQDPVSECGLRGGSLQIQEGCNPGCWAPFPGQFSEAEESAGHWGRSIADTSHIHSSHHLSALLPPDSDNTMIKIISQITHLNSDSVPFRVLRHTSVMGFTRMVSHVKNSGVSPSPLSWNLVTPCPRERPHGPDRTRRQACRPPHCPRLSSGCPACGLLASLGR